jgi:hypothetical protein
METTPKPKQSNQKKSYHEASTQKTAATTQPKMYPEIVSWQNNHIQQPQTSFQKSLKATAISIHPDFYPTTMTAPPAPNELFNVDSLKPSSSLAPPPSSIPLASTILRAEYLAIKETREGKRNEHNAISTEHGDIRKKVATFKTKIETDRATLIKLEAQTSTLKKNILGSTEELELHRLTLTTLKSKSDPIYVEFKALMVESNMKKSELNKAVSSEETATQSLQIICDSHSKKGVLFISDMKKLNNYVDWKMVKDNRNIGSQIEAILCVFFDLPCYFSRLELETLLGYKSSNKNVEGALDRMEIEMMLQKTTNNLGSEVYYLGKFAMNLLERKQTPDTDTRPTEYQASIATHLENGTRAANARKSEKSGKQQKKRDSLTPQLPVVSPAAQALAKRQKTGTQPNLASSPTTPIQESTNEIISISSSSDSDSSDDDHDDGIYGTAARRLAYGKKPAAINKNTNETIGANNSNKEDDVHNDSILTTNDNEDDRDDTNKINNSDKDNTTTYTKNDGTPVSTSKTTPSESLADLEASSSVSNGGKEGESTEV